MAIQVTKTVKIAGGSITLSDLRKFIEETKDFADSAKVSISASHDIREGSYYSVWVTG